MGGIRPGGCNSRNGYVLTGARRRRTTCSIMREIFGIICFAGALQALFLSILLAVKKNNRKANRHLSLFMCFTALDLFELFLGARGHLGPTRPYQLSIIPYSFIFGPSIFLYIALLTARIQSFSKKHLLLYAPFAAVLSAHIILHFSLGPRDVPAAVTHADMIINGGGLIFEAALYALSLVLLQKYIGRLKEYFSAIDAIKLSLIRTALAFLILVVFFILLSLLRDGYVRREYKLLDSVTILISVGIEFIIAFFAMIQPELFNRVRLMENAVPGNEAASGPKYEKFRLPASEEEKHVRNLREYMAEKKPYLQEELTLQEMADDLSLSTQHLSMILNIRIEQNFFNFVNSYRVEEAKRKLVDPDNRNRSILTIAYEAGFNSKSTFNTMFKKFTGKTPREYRAGLSVQ